MEQQLFQKNSELYDSALATGAWRSDKCVQHEQQHTNA
jgi:hypothetical protein